MGNTMNNQQFSYDQAMAAAQALIALIERACERVEIAGSIRRQRPFVHDIDLVVIPKYETIETDLLGGTEQVSQLDQLLQDQDAVANHGGDKIKTGVIDGIPFDIYIASPSTWATLLLIRTGSKEHNIMLTTRARELGMKLCANGTGLVNRYTGDIIAWESEGSIFRALGMAYVEPEKREMKR
jgi:DNA polymerase (family 10)